MTSSVLEISTFFSMSHDCVTVTVTCDITSYFHLIPKIKKSKIKAIEENEKRKGK